MFRSPIVWLAALLVGVMTHIDWHLGRPGHDHLSFHLAYHWLLALPTFALLAWWVHRKWPDATLRVGSAILLLGVFLGQGLEPLSEVITDPGSDAFTSPIRWRIFAEFMGAGILVFALVAGLLLRSRRAETAS